MRPVRLNVGGCLSANQLGKRSELVHVLHLEERRKLRKGRGLRPIRSRTVPPPLVCEAMPTALTRPGC